MDVKINTLRERLESGWHNDAVVKTVVLQQGGGFSYYVASLIKYL